MTTNTIWDKFDKAIDTEGLKEDVKAAKENGGGDFKDVPHGTYEVSIEKLELVPTKKSGDPMLSCWMNIVAGDFTKSKLFYNQVLTSGFGVHLASEFLRSLDSGIDVEFDGFGKFGALIEEVFNVVEDKLEYSVSYTENNKNAKFSDYKILEVFDK